MDVESASLSLCPPPGLTGKAKESIVPPDDAPRRRREQADALRREFERLLMMLHS
jgi:hypothetical protein